MDKTTFLELARKVCWNYQWHQERLRLELRKFYKKGTRNDPGTEVEWSHNWEILKAVAQTQISN